MKKIGRLISEFCSDGVEYKTIKSCILDVEKINWREHSGNLYKYIDLTSVDRITHQILESQEIQAENAPNRAQQIVKTGDILLGATRPMLKRFCVIPNEYDGEICSTGFCVLRANEEYVLNRWLYYIISSTEFFCHVEKFQKGASYPAINDADVKVFSMPVPPIEIQREIIRILDCLTELTAELVSKLTDEVKNRKKQYEFYREALLSPKKESGICWYHLSEIADIGTGSSNTNEGLDEGRYPFFVRSQEVRRKDEYEFDETAIITAGDGVGVGKVLHYVEGKYALHQRAYRIHINTEKVLPRYFYHYMKGTFLRYIEKNAVNSSVTSIRRKMLDDYPIPVPTIEEQSRIIYVLDNIDTICDNLNNSLESEIVARQKQYEYYRDKLLSFKEPGQ